MSARTLHIHDNPALTVTTPAPSEPDDAQRQDRLRRLEDYFGIPYPYEKLDSISLPVNTGAMENPGLVTYGHQLMLSRVAEDTPGRQRGYASVCAHASRGTARSSVRACSISRRSASRRASAGFSRSWSSLSR